MIKQNNATTKQLKRQGNKVFSKSLNNWQQLKCKQGLSPVLI